MLSDFIEKALAQVDDLSELKVTLVALRLLEQKQRAAAHEMISLSVNVTASVTETELLSHPAVQSLSLPELGLRYALQKALAHGTLLEARFGSEPRYFANTDASRRVIEALEAAEAATNAARGTAPVNGYETLRREIQRLEVVQVYALDDDDLALLDEWAACGYTSDEMMAAARLVFAAPRPKQTSPRKISIIGPELTSLPPAEPSSYFNIVIARSENPPEDIVALRELLRRWPNGNEFSAVRAAVAMFGIRIVIDGLKRMAQQNQPLDVRSLVPLLAQDEEAQLAFERGRAQVNIAVKDLLRLYETVIGLPPTEYIARDIKSIYDGDIKDVNVWRAVFEFGARQNKKDWRYLRQILLNPSPNVFMPAPVNEVAQFAFNEYKRRVGRLDPMVAAEINTMAAHIADTVLWTHAFDSAARANALNWNYIRSVLNPPENKDENESGTTRKRIRQPADAARAESGAGRKPKLDYDAQELSEAERRAEESLQAIAKRRAKRNQPGQP